jgi:hypothetical protein
MIAVEHGTATQTDCACGAAATRITNPFATVGLTTYSHAMLCMSCGRVEFAPADAQTTTISVTSRLASSPCTHCDGAVSELPNPYYGIKRAMAPTIRFCTKCDQV